MFGYVKPYHSELLLREYEFYRAAYCGVCRAMRRETGYLSSLSLSYDVVFLALCRMLLTDREVSCKHKRCIAHPLKKRACLSENEALSYAARVSAMLSYEKLLDDKLDGGFFKRLCLLPVLPVFKRASRRAKLSSLYKSTSECLDRLHALEKQKAASVDAPAHEFGDLLGLIFAEGIEKEDERELFYRVGYHLGKFIYAADAADDYAEDKRKGSYNPFVLLYPDADFLQNIPESVNVALHLELNALSAWIEKLPFGNSHALESIIKNTVYLGLPGRIKTLGKAKDKKARR